MGEMLTEKYRPKSFVDIVGLPAEIPKLVTETMPHFLFLGSPGSGKTTTAKVIASTFDTQLLKLNASDERGIDVVRSQIKEFAQTKGIGKFKIVLLDEADYMTHEAQKAMLNIMETYSSNCRFILTANYENKLDSALKSRCVVSRFDRPQKSEIVKRLQNICTKENIPHDVKVLEQITTTFYPDIRKMINSIEQFKDKLMEPLILSRSKDATDLWFIIVHGAFVEARTLIRMVSDDYESLLKEMYELMMADTKIQPKTKADIIHLIAECLVNIRLVAWKEIQMESTLLKIMKVVKA